MTPGVTPSTRAIAKKNRTSDRQHLRDGAITGSAARGAAAGRRQPDRDGQLLGSSLV
jgi:hypothetical protein